MGPESVASVGHHYLADRHLIGDSKKENKQNEAHHFGMH